MTMLKDLYTEIYGPIDGPGRLKNLDELGSRLAALVSKEKPFAARYLNGVLLGHKGMAPSAELQQAMAIMAGQMDGQHPLQAVASPVGVLGINGNIRPGSVVLGKSVLCPGCNLWFVPRVPWQKYCTTDCGRQYRARVVQNQPLCTSSAPAKIDLKAKKVQSPQNDNKEL